ncbi:hypothetical protein V8F20_000713, partial [Naviculisporaceae sp. PSN 640]
MSCLAFFERWHRSGLSLIFLPSYAVVQAHGPFLVCDWELPSHSGVPALLTLTPRSFLCCPALVKIFRGCFFFHGRV